MQPRLAVIGWGRWWRRRGRGTGDRAKRAARGGADGSPGTPAGGRADRGSGAGAEQPATDGALTRIVRVAARRQTQQQRDGAGRNQTLRHNPPSGTLGRMAATTTFIAMSPFHRWPNRAVRHLPQSGHALAKAQLCAEITQIASGSSMRSTMLSLRYKW